jgi:hypothetical protein
MAEAINEKRLEKYIAYHIDTTGEVVLLETERQEYSRLHRCFELMCDRYQPHIILSLLCKEFDISETTARKIVRQTQYVFAKRPEYSKEFYRTLMIEWYTQGIRMAFETREPDSIFSGLDKLARLLGFDKVDGIDPEALRQHNYMVILNGNLKIDMNKVHQLSEADRNTLLDGMGTQIQDIQFEMIEGDGGKQTTEQAAKA